MGNMGNVYFKLGNTNNIIGMYMWEEGGGGSEPVGYHLISNILCEGKIFAVGMNCAFECITLCNIAYSEI
jgi:hypothetical protein